jgi:hypothetical protein
MGQRQLIYIFMDVPPYSLDYAFVVDYKLIVDLFSGSLKKIIKGNLDGL